MVGEKLRERNGREKILSPLYYVVGSFSILEKMKRRKTILISKQSENLIFF